MLASSRSSAAYLGCAALFAAQLSACTERVQKPPAPDMSELIEAYAQPSAPLTRETLPEVQKALGNIVTWLLPLCGFSSAMVTQDCAQDDCLFLCEGLAPLEELLESATNGDNAEARRLQRSIRNLSGYFELVRICPGHEREPTLDARNGSIVLQVGFTSRGIDPVFGGNMFACKVRIGDIPATLTGELALAFQRPFFLDELTEQEVIVRFEGAVKGPDIALAQVSANFQLLARSRGFIGVSFKVAGLGNMVFRNGIAAVDLGAELRSQALTFSERARVCVRPAERVLRRPLLPAPHLRRHLGQHGHQALDNPRGSLRLPDPAAPLYAHRVRCIHGSARLRELQPRGLQRHGSREQPADLTELRVARPSLGGPDLSGALPRHAASRGPAPSPSTSTRPP